MILIAPDKFKGTFTADEMCRLIAERLQLAGVDLPLILKPLADGGEGIASVVMPHARHISQGVYQQNGSQLVVSSEIVGHKAFENSSTPLMHRSSYALGKAVTPGIPTTIAIGGTAVSDGGAGFLQALGVIFYDHADQPISTPLTPATLFKVARADISSLKNYQIKGIVDVKASLVDGQLTAVDFAPQKALPGENLDKLAPALKHFQTVLGKQSPWDGAGGGLGYAVASVIGAQCISGAQAAVNSLNIDWTKISLVITGEGCVDNQTFIGGKLVDAIYRKASSINIPTYIIYGTVKGNPPYPIMHQLYSDWASEIACKCLK